MVRCPQWKGCVGGLPSQEKVSIGITPYSEDTNPKYEPHQPFVPNHHLFSFPSTQTQEVPSAAGRESPTLLPQVSEPTVGKERSIEIDNKLHFDLNFMEN